MIQLACICISSSSERTKQRVPNSMTFHLMFAWIDFPPSRCDVMCVHNIWTSGQILFKLTQLNYWFLACSVTQCAFYFFSSKNKDYPLKIRTATTITKKKKKRKKALIIVVLISFPPHFLRLCFTCSMLYMLHSTIMLNHIYSIYVLLFYFHHKKCTK